ncbi:H-NS histone family protein [Mesobaculum littorinae]|uniref:H-NS histone family protein n=2 Tax=Mesobaculum littorinae TaxID=2486419 RepID=A0A438ADF5_9RHOB|nr:H-NS histone family protein [Mesobaculum littorinae]
MDKDLNQMSQKELEALKADIDQALASLESRRRTEARVAAESAAREHGFSLDELLEMGKARGSRTAKKNPPRYRNPENPTETWTGRGRKPGWIKEALEQGRPLSDLEI